MADSTYRIKNVGSRAVGFRVRGGVETVKPGGKPRTLELKEPLTDEAIADFKERGVEITLKPGPAPAEPKQTDDRPPAETGGVTPQSKQSEEGGVDRKTGDTTTTTKPTVDQTGPKA